MATRITPLDCARFWDNAACVVANRMTRTNVRCLFGRVGELNVAPEPFSAYVERVEMCFTADNMVDTTKEGSKQEACDSAYISGTRGVLNSQ